MPEKAKNPTLAPDETYTVALRMQSLNADEPMDVTDDGIPLVSVVRAVQSLKA